METWTKEVVKIKFKKGLERGAIKYQAVNYELEKNWSFFDKYLLYDKHIILSRIESAKEKSWPEPDKIWIMVQKKELFHSYIEKEIRDFLTRKNDNSNKEKKL